MKKIAIASLIALAATAASALEVGVTASRDFTNADRNAAGVTVGQKAGRLSATVGVERTSVGTDDQNRFSVVAGYDVATIGPVTVTAKAGGAYLANQTADDGYAALVGVGATLPVTKSIALTVDVARQIGQNRVEQFDGNRVTAGVKFSF